MNRYPPAESLIVDAAPTDFERIESVPEQTPAIPPMRTIRRRIPDGVASNVKQCAYLLRDRSGSMGGRKIEELNAATAALGHNLADPANRNGFLVSVIDFHHDADVVVAHTPATELRVPNAQADGGTSFERALQVLLSLLQQRASSSNPEGWHWLRPQVLFLSDGQSSVADSTIQMAQEYANITSIAYGDDADLGTLRRIASDGQVLPVGTDAGALRALLAAVGQTLSKGLQGAR